MRERVYTEVGMKCIRAISYHGATFEKGRFYWIVSDNVEASSISIADKDGNVATFDKHEGDLDYFRGFFEIIFV